MTRYVPRVCQCGCNETFMARAQDVKRGYGLYKNRSHANKGENNPRWVGGRSTENYYYKLRSIASHPERHECRRIFESRLRAGILRRGCCEFCGSTHVEGHHEDYSDPLRVRWVCRKHHYLLDKWRREREMTAAWN